MDTSYSDINPNRGGGKTAPTNAAPTTTTTVARAVRRALRPRVRWEDIHPIAATKFTLKEEARALRCALADIRRNNPDRALDAHGIFDLACFIGAELFYDHRYDGTEADVVILAMRAALHHEDELPPTDADKETNP